MSRHQRLRQTSMLCTWKRLRHCLRINHQPTPAPSAPSPVGRRFQEWLHALQFIFSLPSSSIPSVFICEKMDLRVLQLGQHSITKKALKTKRIKIKNMISAITHQFLAVKETASFFFKFDFSIWRLVQQWLREAKRPPPSQISMPLDAIRKLGSG